MSRTTQQNIRFGHEDKIKKSKSAALGGSPQLKGVITLIKVVSPKKPNSAQRKVAIVSLSNGKKTSVYIPGEGHNLQENHWVLVAGGGPSDLPGVNYHAVRGALDCSGVDNRKNGRSHAGTKKSKKS